MIKNIINILKKIFTYLLFLIYKCKTSSKLNIILNLLSNGDNNIKIFISL